jgi:hypothetical protein
MKRMTWLARGIVVLLALGLYLHTAGIQLYHVNTDPERSDQSACMGYAIKLEESGYTYVGDRNRMPLFPILSSVLYHEGMSEEEFFVRGKWFNVALSVLLLVGLLAIFRRHPSPHGAANLLGIVAFTLFVFKAPCFQGELLYYTLNFTGFWLLSRLLARPRPLLGLLAGVALAAAQYTKASALPGLVLFLGVALVSLMWGQRGRCQPMLKRLRGVLRAPLTTAAPLCLAVFLLLLSPYLINSERQYGRSFYNVNTTFYMWYDSWEEVKEGTRAYGDREGWPTMPEEQIPSLTRYVQTHSLRDIAQRELHGIWVLLRDRVNSYGYLKYAVGAWVLGVALAVRRPTVVWAHLARYRWVALFWVTYLVGYFLAYALWVPISPAPRLVLALFIPFMWAMSVTIDRLIGDLPSLAMGSRRVPPRVLINALVSAVVAVDAVLIASVRIAQHYGCT